MSAPCEQLGKKARRGFSLSSQVTPHLVETTILYQTTTVFHVDGCRGLSLALRSAPIGQRDSFKHMSEHALSLWSPLLVFPDRSPPPLPLGAGAASLLAFLLFLKQATLTFVALRLLLCGLGMLFHQRATWFTPQSSLYLGVTSVMPSLITPFTTAAPTPTLHVAPPGIISLHCIYHPLTILCVLLTFTVYLPFAP